MGQCVVGDTLELLNKIPDESVNLVLTSPPYALQRIYRLALSVWRESL